MSTVIKPRRYARIGLHNGPLVAWQGVSVRTVSRIATLGLGGLFIAAARPAKLGEGIKMAVHVPGGVVRARAMVRNSHPGRGMGVEFTSMKPDDRARLHQLVRQLLSDLTASVN